MIAIKVNMDTLLYIAGIGPTFSNPIHVFLRVVAMDMRGYGDSEKPTAVAEYSTEKLVADIHDLIEYLGIATSYSLLLFKYLMDIRYNCPKL